jgi:hypothetical protein
MTTPAPMSGARVKALVVYIVISGLFVLGVIIAYILAGHGVFGLQHHNLNPATGGKQLDDQKVLDAHRALGTILGLVAILQLIAVVVARPGKVIVIGTVVLVILAAIGQPLFAGIGNDHSWGGALHVLNAGVILVMGVWLHLAARTARAALRGEVAV